MLMNLAKQDICCLRVAVGRSYPSCTAPATRTDKELSKSILRRAISNPFGVREGSVLSRRSAAAVSIPRGIQLLQGGEK